MATRGPWCKGVEPVKSKGVGVWSPRLQEQLATTASCTKVLEQENGNLTWDLEASHSQENNALDEISLMLSWTQLEKEKANKAEASLEDVLEQMIDLQLHSTGLEKIIKELKEKISQDEASLSEWKKT